MKKSLLLLLAAFLITATSLSAKGPYNLDDRDLNAGIGLGSTLVGDVTLPPISASYDVAVHKDFSVGAYLGFAMSEETWSAYTWTYTHLIIGARGAYHFYNQGNIDGYGGLMIGYNVVSVEEPSEWAGYGFDAQASAMTYSLFVGGRYYFNNGIGAYAELGYGVAYLSIGVTLPM